MSEIIPVSSVAGMLGSKQGSVGQGGFGAFLGDAALTAGEIASGGLSALGGGLGLSTDLFGLLEMQRQLQMEMETVSMISNIDKSKHESKMAAIRNIRTN